MSSRLTGTELLDRALEALNDRVGKGNWGADTLLEMAKFLDSHLFSDETPAQLRDKVNRLEWELSLARGEAKYE